jgi:integrase
MRGRKSIDEKRRLIDKDVIPAIGRMELASVKRRDLVLILEGIAGRGAPVTANRVREVLVHAFAWAADREEIEVSPAAGLKKVIVEKPKDTVVPIADLVALWHQLAPNAPREKHGKPVSPAVAGALKLIMLTACRTADARDATVGEFDLEAGIWAIPGSRFKTGDAHRVLLSKPAAAIIEAAAEGKHEGDLLFSARTVQSEPQPLGDKSLIQALRRLNGGRYTVHDLRRSTATHMAELGVEPHVVERVLGHKVQGIAAVYNRARYDEPARAAWDLWARRFMAAVSGVDNVTPLRVAS